ncbi:sensor histidine kinase [Paenibacillus thailandensis]|uniref:histidine kinase n=1 Tax=Paenibacillus thailandensis TaxID=393250 RepID=A0ABW5R407_9BACL
MDKWMRGQPAQLLLCALITALAGQLRITPFSGEGFRIGLGTSAFLLCLLLFRKLPFVRAGLVTGLTVLLFRTALDLALAMSLENAGDRLLAHCPAGVYYVAFAFMMSRIRHRWRDFPPLLLGAYIAGVDFISNEAELLARSFIYRMPVMSWQKEWLLLAGTAVIRSYFVIGVYSSMTISRMKVLHQEQQKRMEQMLNIGSGLYGEVFYLRKSMNTIESITARSHELYTRLTEAGLRDVSRSVLELTQQIHEVKKDSQRILAGLLKLFDRETASEMRMDEIVDFVIKSNYEYMMMLGKAIVLEKEVWVHYITERYIPLITVLNNLVSNAVEAIEAAGVIKVEVETRGGRTVLTVTDNGPGIMDQDREMIFEPGFTTKFSQTGYAATGIGLSHVREIVGSLGGGIRLFSEPGRTSFVVEIPTERLKEGV